MFGIEKLSSVMRAAALGCLMLTAGVGITAMTPAYADIASSKAAVGAPLTALSSIRPHLFKSRQARDGATIGGPQAWTVDDAVG